MSTNSGREKCSKSSKRPRTEDESLFTDVTIPLSLPSLQHTIQPCELAPEELEVQQEFDFSTQHNTASTETIRIQGDSSKSSSEDFGQETFQAHCTIKFIDEEELDLDSMWNDVCETLIAESSECELRDWGSSEEDDDDQFENIIVEDMTLPRTENTSFPEAGVDSCEEPPAENIKSSTEQEKLYPGARVNIGAVMVLLTLYVIKYDLTGEAITHLLQFISLLLPPGNGLPDTLRKFKTYFSKLESPVILHHYCAYCLSSVDKQASTCPNTACMKALSSRNAKAYFVEIPVVHQLSALFSRNGFYSDIQYRFNRKKKHPDNVEDIYDGELYKKLWKNFLSCPDNVSFLFNCDGVPVFKSSKVSIWPLYLVINELSYSKRMANENMVFAGLWFGEKKPAMWTFLKPHSRSFAALENGVYIESPERGNFLCKGIVLACTCDLPARCLLCNGMQYNGENGCWKCLQPGQTVKTGVRGHSRAFLYQDDNPKGPLRTSESVKENGVEAARRQKRGVSRYIVNGVKGPSWFSLLKHFDLVRGMGIDYMHGVLLGVQKLLLTLWFSPTFSKERFSIFLKVEYVDERLSQILPSSEIKRLPRSISEHLKYWKASELRSFLLFYGLPTLYGLLPDNYFSHYTLFVHAIFILLQESISQADLQEADRLLDGFCKSFSNLYHPRFHTLNVHQLLHLVDDVRDLGPLYTHSCFAFEDKNGFLLKLIHGTQFIDSQIISAVSVTQKLPELREKCVPEGSEVDLLYKDLSRVSKSKFRTEILPNIYALSATYQVCLATAEMNALENYLGFSCPKERFWAFNRLEITTSSSIICGLAYKRMHKRNCAVVRYSVDNTWAFAMVKFFIKYERSSTSEQPLYLAIAHPILCENYNPKIHINRVTSSSLEEITVLDVKDIYTNCLYISLTVAAEGRENCMAYVCEFPNKKECD